jgi:hypothetical protein
MPSQNYTPSGVTGNITWPFEMPKNDLLHKKEESTPFSAKTRVHDTVK